MITTHRDIAKLTGLLLFIQMIGGIYVNFFLLNSLQEELSYLSVNFLNAISGIATVLIILLSSINLAIGIVNFNLFAKRQPRLYLGMISISIVALALTALEVARLSEFTSLLSSFVEAGTTQLDQLQQQLRQMVANGRNKTHFIAIQISSFSMLLFYMLLYKGTRIPKLLVHFAVLSCSLQIIAIGNSFFNSSIPMLMQLPLLLTQIAVPGYLIIKGYKYIDARSNPYQSKLTLRPNR